jgi:cytoskeletal protein RodZ
MVRVGQRLYDERIRRKLSLEEISTATKIKARFLAAIEKGEYHKLPSPAYAQGFVQNYAAYLGIPKAEILALFKREFEAKKAFKVLPDSLVKTKEFPLRRIKIQQSIIGAGMFLLLILGYLLFQYRFVYLSPKLIVTSPKQESTVSQEVTVTGQTDSSATVTVNNEPVFVDNNGEFSKKITLFSGKTFITIRAKNRLGKETIIKRSVTVTNE